MSNGQETEAQLDKNFKIPRKKSEEIGEGAPEAPPTPIYDTQAVMANSYYNYQYQQLGMYGQWPGYYGQYQAGSSQESLVEPMTQKIYSTLLAHKEKPKTYTNNIFKETVPDADDSTLPKELTSQFQPLYCKLCSAQLSSNVMAKLHYKSKNHEKKIRKFLIEFSEKTGEPLHKRAKLVKNNVEEETEARFFHCDVCDLPLTGKLHAESHYMGKNHQKAVMGHKNPAGKGFYNENGKWIRVKPSKIGNKDFPGGDNIGLAFRPPEVADKTPEVAVKMPATQGKFHCDLCNVGATCQQQLEMHFKGQKHQKKMKLLGLQSESKDVATSDEQKPTIVDQDIFKVYRTPSGNYYCQICNMTVNSESQFKVHLSGKNHHKNLGQPK